MPCMGAEKDDQIAGLVVAEVRKIEKFEWQYVYAIMEIERAVDRALAIKDGRTATGWVRTRQISCLVYGFLDGRQPGDVDWESLREKLDEAIWSFDCVDF